MEELFMQNKTLQSLQLNQSTLTDAGVERMLHALCSNTCLGIFSLWESQLTDRAVPAMEELFMQNKTLQCLELPKSTLTNGGVERMLHALCSNTCLQTFSLWESQLTDRAVPAMEELFIQNKTLKSIKLYKSTLSDYGAQKVLDALSNNTTLLGLSLDESRLTDSVVQSLVTFLLKSKMLFFQFDDSVFTDDGMERLLTAAVQNHTLKYLGLWRCPLTDKAVPALVDFLENNETLQSLKILISTFSDSGIGPVMHALAHNRSLQKLSIRECKMTDQAAPALVHFLTSNTTLHTLQFTHCRFSDVGLELILRALAANHSLQALSLFKNELTDKVAPALSQLVNNKKLQSVRILGGQLSDENTEKLLMELGKQQVLTDFRIDVGCKLTDAGAHVLCEFLRENRTRKTLVLRAKMTDKEVMDDLRQYPKKTRSLIHRPKERMVHVPRIVLQGQHDITSAKVSDSGFSSSRVFSADSDSTVPATREELKQDAGFAYDTEEEDISDATSGQPLQSQFSQLQLTTTQEQESSAGQESSDASSPMTDEDEAGLEQGSMSSTTEEDEAVLCDLPSLTREKKSADLFFGGKGGTLQVPGSDVLLCVPPHAVPPGKVYVVYGTIHTNLREYNPWMSSEQLIVGPVAEFKVENDEVFDEAVEVVIPHCVRPDKTGNIRVLCGTGSTYREIRKDDSDVTYCIERDVVRIYTRHFTRFMVTSTGREEEITDALITIAALKKDTVTSIRMMIHSGCSKMSDFTEFRKQFYSPGMEEIERDRVELPETEDVILPPTIYINLKVDADCDGTIWEGDGPKETEVKKMGKNVLRLPKYGQHRSEKLANFIIEGPRDQPSKCSIRVTFDYGEESDQVVEKYKVIFPDKTTDQQVQEGSGEMAAGSVLTEGDLSYDTMKQCIRQHTPMIMQRLTLSPMFLRTLVAAEVLNDTDLDNLDVDNKTRHQKIDIILGIIVQKGTKIFLDFCIVLEKLGQEQVVTEVMGFSISYIHSQRALYEPPTTDQPSTSGAASASLPAGAPLPSTPLQASSKEHPQPTRPNVPHSGIPRLVTPHKRKPRKQSSPAAMK